MRGLDESDKGSFQNSGRQWRLLLFPKMKNQKRPVIAEQISLIVLKNHAPFLRILAIFLFQGVKNRSVKIGAAQKPGPVFHIPCYDSPFGSNSILFRSRSTPRSAENLSPAQSLCSPCPESDFHFPAQRHRIFLWVSGILQSGALTCRFKFRTDESTCGSVKARIRSSLIFTSKKT